MARTAKPKAAVAKDDMTEAPLTDNPQPDPAAQAQDLAAEQPQEAPEPAEAPAEVIAERDESPVEDAPDAEPAPPEPALPEPPLPEPPLPGPPLPGPDPERAAVPPPGPALAPQVTVQKVGFVPLVLGGVVAAALGFVAAYVGGTATRDAQQAEIARLSGQVEALSGQLAAIPAPPDLTPLADEVAQLRGLMDAGDGLAADAIAAIDARIAELEKAPSADGTLTENAIAAWERELDTLRVEIAAQQERMQQVAEDAAAQLEVTRSEAVTIEQSAVAAARDATARAAATRIQAAIDAGTPYDSALADLAALPDIVVPDTLVQSAAEGVATIAALQEAFPPAARAALAVARAEGVAGDEGGKVMAFLRNQFDVRSVTPRDGDAPDAVLSRAENALREGRLTDALAEVAALPEVVRAEMAGWTALAEGRAAAVSAANTLLQSTNAN